MVWQETQECCTYQLPDTIVDVSYAMSCRSLPMDHAYALRTALVRTLPWLEDEIDAGVHLIHGAESGNGWYRPTDTQMLQLPRRTRLVLRLPKHRLRDAQSLTGNVLYIDGCALEVGATRIRPLSLLTTLFSRHVVCGTNQSEQEFEEQMAFTLFQMGVEIHKLLCGQPRKIAIPGNIIDTRSLMLADLEVPHSVLVQQKGLGPNRTLGCGLFVPHKTVGAVVSAKNG